MDDDDGIESVCESMSSCPPPPPSTNIGQSDCLRACKYFSMESFVLLVCVTVLLLVLPLVLPPLPPPPSTLLLLPVAMLALLVVLALMPVGGQSVTAAGPTSYL